MQHNHVGVGIQRKRELQQLMPAVFSVCLLSVRIMIDIIYVAAIELNTSDESDTMPTRSCLISR